MKGILYVVLYSEHGKNENSIIRVVHGDKWIRPTVYRTKNDKGGEREKTHLIFT